jgi:hypothetical protein
MGKTQTTQTKEKIALSSSSPSFETVWAIMQENALQFKELRKESALELKELRKENALQLKELRKTQKETAQAQRETDRQMKDFNKRFGKFTNSFGDVVEHMVAPNLQKKFRELGLCFQRTSKNVVMEEGITDLQFEIDVMLENNEKAMLVEVKTRLTIEDVKDHIARLKKMRKYAESRGENRMFLGAVAGVVMHPRTKTYALEQGFFVVEPSGETFNITSPQSQPKEW